jgi:predicted AlkP superfamily pyrophosphatase or phosphodiesterase
MTSLVPSFLPLLKSHRLPQFNAGTASVYPYYERHSLVSLPASICHWLGIPPFGAPALADEILNALGGPFRQVIRLVVDGLGLEQLNHFSNSTERAGSNRSAFWQRLLDDAVLAPITSITPSTTASALTSLWTGQPAAVHGVMGYEMYLKEYSLIANMITHAPTSFYGDVGGIKRAGFDPGTFLPVPTFGPHLGQHGIQVDALQHMAIAHSGLSTMLFPGVNVVPFRSPSDLWVTLPALLAQNATEKAYTYIYWGELDELSHRFGPINERVNLEFSLFSYLLEGFLDGMRKHSRGDTLFLMTADHGHLHTPKTPLLDMRFHPDFCDCISLYPSGENRLAYLYLKPGAEQRLMDYVATTWPGKFELVSTQNALAAGLFGPGQAHPQLAERTGDYILIAQEDAYLWWANKDNILLGRHGGMTQVEMVVPLLGLVI